MVRSRVPGMDDESQYIPFIIKGLRARPSLQSQVSTLLVSNHHSISSLHLTIRTIASSQEEIWSLRGRGRRGGRRGRGRGRGQPSIYEQRPIKAESAAHGAGSSYQGRPRRGGRGRGRGYHQANAVIIP